MMAVLRRVRPRTAGITAIVLGVLLAVAGGVMIAHAPVSILGAIVLVPATILVAIGCVWLLRRDWDEPWPPDVRPSLARQLRIRRALVLVSGVLLPVAVAYGIYSGIRGEWWALAYSLLLCLNSGTNLFVFWRARVTPSADSESVAPD